MGKLPLDQRPPVGTLERFLAVSPDIRQHFNVDLQNDCACEVEVYDIVWQVVYWSKNGLVKSVGHRLELPILPGVLTDETVLAMVLEAGMTQEKFEMYDLLEYGVLTANLAGWGAFCIIPEQVF